MGRSKIQQGVYQAQELFFVVNNKTYVILGGLCLIDTCPLGLLLLFPDNYNAGGQLFQFYQGREDEGLGTKLAKLVHYCVGYVPRENISLVYAPIDKSDGSPFNEDLLSGSITENRKRKKCELEEDQPSKRLCKMKLASIFKDAHLVFYWPHWLRYELLHGSNA